MRKKSGNFDSISVIVPTLDGKKVIGNLISSIYKQRYPDQIEIIAVDDGSIDKTSTYLKTTWPKVKVARFAKNKGSAPALNRCAKMAKGKFILATNDDVVFENNSLKALMDCWHSQKNVGIVTGKMLGPSRKLAIPGFRINHFLGYHPYDLENTDKIREADWAVGACLLIKKDLLKKVGYFDSKFIFCGEEYDLSFQIKRLGLKILYTPHAIFYHAFRRTHRPSVSTLFAHYRGKIRYMFKNAKPVHLLIFLPAQFVFVPFLYIFQKKWLHIMTIYRALFWNIANLPQTLKSRYTRPELTPQGT